MVRIITDSAADLEPLEYEKLGVVCIPLRVSFGDTDYQENVDLTKDQFYRLLEQSEEFPRTAQASLYEVECLMKEAMDAGDEMIVISLSSGFSGFYQNLMMTKNMLGYEKCYVIDSLTGTGGQRLLVEYAAKLRDEGRHAAEIALMVGEMRSRIVLYACMDTLEYLYKGGRISQTAYRVGNVANIKPILHISTEGLCEIPTKALGMRRGMDFMCKRLEERTPDSAHPLYVMFTGKRENGEILAGRLRMQGYEIPEDRIINVGAAIGSHIGPNACGLVYIAEQ